MIKRFLWLVVFSSLIGAVVGCDDWLGQNQEKSKEFPGTRESVSISVPKPPSNWLTIIAVDQNFFSLEGLEVIPKNYPSGKRALLGMLAGEVDLATTARVPFVFNSLKRQDFSVLATIGTSSNDDKIIVRKDRGILKPEDLKGKRMATHKSSSSHFFLHLFLIKHNILDSEIEISFAKVEKLPEFLNGGKVDAISSREPFLSEAKRLLGDKAIIFSEPSLYLKSFNLVAFNSFIEKKPEIIKRVLRTMLRAEEFVKKHPNQAIKIIANNLEIPESIVAENFKTLDLSVHLEEELLLALEDQAKWIMGDKFEGASKFPNYLNFMYFKPLQSIRPKAVTIIH